MENIRFRRLMAYLIDILVVSLLVMLISNIKVLNPKDAEYKKAYKEYTEYTETISNSTLPLQDMLDKEYLEIVYNMSYYSLSYTIIEVVVILLYFTLFPRFNNNQTIGKKFFKLTVACDNKDKKPTIWTHLLRSLMLPIWTNIILYTNIYNILSIIVLLLFNASLYIKIVSALSIAVCIYCYVDVVMMLSSKDNVSLHDKITRTRVVDYVKAK